MNLSGPSRDQWLSRAKRRPEPNQRETSKITKTKIVAAVTALTLAAAIAVPTSEAQARGWGIAAGIVGGAIVGAAIANSAAPAYYNGYYRCHFVRQYDAYGYYIGTAKVCP